MNIMCSVRDGVTVMHLVSPERLELPLSARLECQLKEVAGDCTGAYVLDFRDVSYVDSTGLAALIAFHQFVLEQGGSVVVSGLTDNVRRIFELTRLDKVFVVVKERDSTGTSER